MLPVQPEHFLLEPLDDSLLVPPVEMQNLAGNQVAASGALIWLQLHHHLV